MLRNLPIVLSLLLAPPALADTTAVYALAGGQKVITIEIASNGNQRMETFEPARHGPPATALITLTLGSESYLIQPKGDMAGAVRMRDVAAVVAEYVALQKRPPPRASTAATLKIVAGDPVTVHGRVGTPYFLADDSAARPEVAVISLDPDLSELAGAMASHLGMAFTMRQLASPSNGESEFLVLLKTGAPLRFAGLELIELNHNPIPAQRFLLRAEPLSFDQVRTLLQREMIKRDS